MPTAFVVTPATAPAPLNVVGEKITVLASGAQTGSYEIFRQAGPEGSGPPPHCHPWDESFFVVKGEIAAEPGTLVHRQHLATRAEPSEVLGAEGLLRGNCGRPC